MRTSFCAGLLSVVAAGSLAQGVVNFTGLDLATVSSPAGQNFAYTVAGGGAGMVNVRLVDGQVAALNVGASPDLTGFYALQNIGDLTPATFRFTFDVARPFRIDQNETLTDIETNTFTSSGPGWTVLSSSNAIVTNAGPTVSFLGTTSAQPFGTYAIAGSGTSFDFRIVNSNAFPIAGSAISLTVVPEPTSLLAASLLGAGMLRRRKRQVACNAPSRASDEYGALHAPDVMVTPPGSRPSRRPARASS